MCYECARDYRDRLKTTAERTGLKIFPSLTDEQRQQVLGMFETLASDKDVYADFMLGLAGFLIEYPSAAASFQTVLQVLVEAARQRGLIGRTHEAPTPVSPEHTIADFPEFEKELKDLTKAGLLQSGTKKVQ